MLSLFWLMSKRILPQLLEEVAAVEEAEGVN